MKFNELSLPILASEMDLKINKLWYINKHKQDFYYNEREIIKKGKKRIISEPRYYLKKKFKSLHKFLQKEFKPHGNVHGGAKRKSCFTNAKVHKGRRYAMSFDIKDCYPSITEKMLRDELKKMGFNRSVSIMLSKLFTFNGCIPQGSPISSDALNLYFDQFDSKLSSFVGQFGGRYGRVYDDIVISLESDEHIDTIKEFVTAEINGLGLRINEKKRKKQGFQDNAKQKNKIHNIEIHRKDGVGIVKEHRSKSLHIAELYVRSARSFTADNIEQLAQKRQKLHGWISHCSQAKYGNSEHIKKLLDSGDKIIYKRLKEKGIMINKQWYLKKNIVIIKGMR